MSGKSTGAKAAAKPAAKAGAASAAAKGAKKPTAAPAAAPQASSEGNPLHPSRKKNFRIGNDVQHKTDLSRFVKWPRNVRLQRQKKVLYERLKVPPAINQFSKPLDAAESKPFFQLLSKYAPEDKATKAKRLDAEAEAKSKGLVVAKPKPYVTKFGLNHVTTLVETKKAKLVVIASDVDPVELVLWLPALCRKMGVPYVIVNNKGKLGALVHQKKASALAVVDIKDEDKAALSRLVETAEAKFVNNSELRKKWGGGLMGLKTNARLEKRAKALALEQQKRAAL